MRQGFPLRMRINFFTTDIFPPDITHLLFSGCQGRHVYTALYGKEERLFSRTCEVGYETVL